MVFDVCFVSYRGTYKEINTEKLNVPTSEGRRGILSNHMPIMLPLVPGIVETLENKEICHYIIANGLLYFENNSATIVCNHVIDVNEIVLDSFIERKQVLLEKIDLLEKQEDKLLYNNELAFIDEAIKFKDN